MLFELAHKAPEDVGMSTDATCLGGFSWMYNSLGESPCLVAAKVVGACHGGNWKVGRLPSGGSYIPPSSTMANACSCSNSAYNLLSACATCQRRNITLWVMYFTKCTEHQRSKIYLSESIPGNVSIPYWATQDPGTFDSHAFNESNARIFAGQGFPDLVPGTSYWEVPATSPAKVSWTATAVVGGLLGALVGAMLLIDIALYLLYRRVRRVAKAQE